MLVALFEDATSERDQRAERDPVRIEMLLLQQGKRTAGRAALLRIGVGAHAARHHAGMRFLVVEAAADMRSDRLGMLAPARRQPRIQVGRGARGNVYVAIDDIGAGGGRKGKRAYKGGRVHGESSDARGGSVGGF